MKIAEAFVEISARMEKLRGGIREAVRVAKVGGARITKALSGAMLSGIRTLMSTIRRMLAGLLRFTIQWAKRLSLAIGIGLGFSIKLAADAEEIFSRLGQVMGTELAAAIKWIDQLSRAVLRSRTAIAKSVSTFQAFFIGLRFTTKSARTLAQTMTQLALDFASANNLMDSEAVERFIAALSGSGEVLAMFGVDVKQAALDQQLLALGFKKTTQGATEQQKAIARVALIMDTLARGKTTGDLFRTMASFTNRMKSLLDTLLIFGEEIGNLFIKPGADILLGVMKRVQEMTDSVKSNADTLTAKLISVFGVISEAWKITSVFMMRVIKAVSDEVSRLLDKIKELVRFDELEGGIFDKLVTAAKIAGVKIKAELVKPFAVIGAISGGLLSGISGAGQARQEFKAFPSGLAGRAGAKVGLFFLPEIVEAARRLSKIDRETQEAVDRIIAQQRGAALPETGRKVERGITAIGRIFESMANLRHIIDRMLPRIPNIQDLLAVLLEELAAGGRAGAAKKAKGITAGIQTTFGTFTTSDLQRQAVRELQAIRQNSRQSVQLQRRNIRVLEQQSRIIQNSAGALT